MITKAVSTSNSTQRELDRLSRWVFLRFGLWVAIGGGLLVGWVFFNRPAQQYQALMMLAGGMVLSWLVAWGIARLGYIRTALLLGMSVAIIGVGLMVFNLQTGLQAPALALLPLIVTMAGVLGSAAYACYAALLSVGVVAGLYGLERMGLLRRLEASADMAPIVFVAGHLLVLVVAFVAAILISRVLIGALRGAIDQESRFKALLDIGADWYWEQDAELRYTFFSDSYARVTGQDPGLLLGLRRVEHPGWVANQLAVQAHLAALAAHQPFRDFVTIETMPDGSERHYSVSGEPRFDRQGRFAGYWGVARDVTREVHARQMADASAAQFRNLFRASPMPALIHRGLSIIMVNAAAERLLGESAAGTLVGADLRTLFDDRHRSILSERDATVLQLPLGEALSSIELEARLAGRSRALVQVSCARVQLQDGPAVQTQLIDVSAMRKAQAALQRSDVLLAKIYQATTDAVALCSVATGQIVYVNPGFTRMMGYPSHEAVGRTAGDLKLWAHDEDRIALNAQLAGHGEARMPVAQLRARDGRLLANEVTASTFVLDGERHALIIHRDITETELARVLNDAVLNSASVGIAVTRLGFFVRVNPMLAAMLGWEPGALEGQPISVCVPDSMDLPAKVVDYRARATRGETLDEVVELRRRDDSLFWCRVRVKLLDPHVQAGGMVVVAQDISTEVETQRALARAKESAEAASMAKSAFLANTSHEIRTPLNAVLGLARLARDTTDVGKRDQYIGRLVESAESLVAIISDTLDLSKIEAGKLSLEAVGFDLPRLLHAVHQAYIDAAADRGLALTLDLADDLPWVVGDAVRLRQILGNFLSNAVKFTERGQVSLRARLSAAGRLTVDITDTGIGISPAVAERLFHPFTQADTSTTRRYGGTGLGLSICRELAHLMGGEVGVESQPGEGSRFWLELPVEIARPDSRSETASGTAHSMALAGTRVLLVEDNELNRLIASTMLESWGAEVVEAFDGALALAAMQRERGRIDLILMDVHMPVMNGYEATRQLRLTPDGARVPIIALTAAALVSEREQALSVGMNDFVSKPVDVDQMYEVVSRWVRRGVMAGSVAAAVPGSVPDLETDRVADPPIL